MALKLDSSNPRVYLQKAQTVYYTPESFGGGAKKALPLYEVALEKFKVYKSDNAVMPHWGKDIAEKMIDRAHGRSSPATQKDEGTPIILQVVMPENFTRLEEE